MKEYFILSYGMAGPIFALLARAKLPDNDLANSVKTIVNDIEMAGYKAIISTNLPQQFVTIDDDGIVTFRSNNDD